MKMTTMTMASGTKRRRNKGIQTNEVKGMIKIERERASSMHYVNYGMRYLLIQPNKLIQVCVQCVFRVQRNAPHHTLSVWHIRPVQRCLCLSYLAPSFYSILFLFVYCEFCSCSSTIGLLLVSFVFRQLKFLSFHFPIFYLLLLQQYNCVELYQTS